MIANLTNNLIKDPRDLNFEALIKKAITKHARGILAVYQHTLENGPFATMFSFPGELSLLEEGKDRSYVSKGACANYRLL